MVAIPIWKIKGDKAECDNYRGVTLVNTATKVAPKIIAWRLAEIASSSKLPDVHRAYREGRGEAAMTNFLGRRLSGVAVSTSSMDVAPMFIDLSQAFDAIPGTHCGWCWERYVKYQTT